MTAKTVDKSSQPCQATFSEFVDDRPQCLVCGKRGKSVCFPINWQPKAPLELKPLPSFEEEVARACKKAMT